VDVPVDSHIWVRYDQTGTTYPDVVLRDASGAEVEAEISYRHWGLGLAHSGMVRLAPSTPLASDTEYRIEVMPGVEAEGFDLCAWPDETEFWTGANSSVTPGQAPSMPNVEVELIEASEPNGPCDAGEQRLRYTLRTDAVEGAVLYELRQGALEVALDFDVPMSKPSYTGYGADAAGTDGLPMSVWERLSADGISERLCFSFVALDAAGRPGPESPEVCVGEEAPVESCGCSAGVSGALVWSGPLWGLLLFRRRSLG